MSLSIREFGLRKREMKSSEGSIRRKRNQLYFLVLRKVAHEGKKQHLLEMSLVREVYLEDRKVSKGESKDQSRA